jgi:hypothetical protein
MGGSGGESVVHLRNVGLRGWPNKYCPRKQQNHSLDSAEGPIVEQGAFRPWGKNHLSELCQHPVDRPCDDSILPFQSVPCSSRAAPIQSGFLPLVCKGSLYHETIAVVAMVAKIVAAYSGTVYNRARRHAKKSTTRRFRTHARPHSGFQRHFWGGSLRSGDRQPVGRCRT